jgi:hypothetical protein
LFILFTALFVLACTGGALASTATPVPTNTPPATNTPLSTSTPLPPPTETAIPPTPTPVEVGQVVKYGSLEITLLVADGHTLIVPGGKTYYYAKNGGAFLDLGVLVKNTDPGNPVKINWNQVYIVEENGDAWAPAFADVKISNSKIDPDSIGINTAMTKALSETAVEFGDDTYMRLIYVVKNINQTILFGIEGSPQTKIEFTKK